MEIGAGTGFNLPFYGEGVVRVVATEPDAYMLRRAEKRARDSPVPVELKLAQAEALPFRDDSFDTAVSTLVMCTVADPVAALAEVRRVLKPGGELRFYEHVRSRHRLLALAQHAITPFTRLIDGCHHNRDSAAAIERAGFDIRELEWVNRTEIKGVAVAT